MEDRAAKIYKLGPLRVTGVNLRRLIITDIFVLLMILIPVFVAFAAEVIANGTFSTDLSSWTTTQVVSGMTVAHDASGAANGGSVSFLAQGRRTDGHSHVNQSPTINATDTVQLSFQWKKNFVPSNKAPGTHDLYVQIEKPSTATAQIWIDSTADDSNNWTSYNQDISSFFDESGTYEIRFGANFTSGNNASAEAWGWFDEISVDVTGVSDTTPPTGVAITDPTEGQVINATYTLNANATDETEMDRVEFYHGGSTLIGTDNTEPQPFTFGWDTTGVGDGAYSLTALAYDTSSNSTPSAAINVTVDNTDPTSTITDPTPSQLLPGTNYAVVGTADDTNFAEYTLEYGAGASPGSWLDIGTNPRVSSVVAATLGTWDTSVLSSGTYTVRLITTDEVSQTSTATVTVTIDSVDPTVTSATEIDPTTADVLFSEDMDGATIQAGDFSIDGGLSVSGAVLQGDNRTVRLTTSSQTPSQTYTVTVSAVSDVAGNNIGSPNSAQFSGFFSDTTDPTVSITDPTEGQFIDATYTLNANASDDTEMDRVEFYHGGSTLIGTDNSPPQPFTFGWDTTGVGDGAYSLTAVAYDTSANSATSTAINVTVDNTNPTSAITDPTPSQLLPGTNYAVIGTASDTNFTQYTLEYGVGASPVSWFDIGTNPRVSSVVAATLGTWDTSVLSSGTYTVRLITTDEVSQTSTATVTVTIDSVDPTVTSATEIDPTTADVLFSEDMDVATIQAGDFSIDNGLTVSGAVLQGDNVTVRLTTSSQTGGLTYTVTVSNVSDVAGNNIGSPNSAQFSGFLDSTPPSVSITDPTEGQFINSTYGLSANATDDMLMDRVEFYYGGSTLIGTDGSARRSRSRLVGTRPA